MVSDAGSNSNWNCYRFSEGSQLVADKLVEAEKAIQDGADDLDFVCNYEAFKMAI
jgi:deoxyribose-phosphate aldolase